MKAIAPAVAAATKTSPVSGVFYYTSWGEIDDMPDRRSLFGSLI